MGDTESRAFLRSINIAMDVGEPGRFLHFQPTSKSLKLFRSVLEPSDDHALLVVAPYGSGKSLAAGYLLHAVQNEPQRYAAGQLLLDCISDRVLALDDKLGRALKSRDREGPMGVGISLHGHYASTAEALKQAFVEGFRRAGLGREARSIARLDGNDSDLVTALVQVASQKLEQSGRDHLLIIWDEFGRHLEALVNEGRPSELLALQVLAEATNRAQGARVTLVLLLHRSFMGYAGGLPNSARQEWAKIEGRFRVQQFIDDSVEMHTLLASVVASMRPQLPPRTLDSRADAAASKAAGVFRDVEQKPLEGMLQSAWPMDPATLWLLPRISSRVAQNERTAFSFLHAVDLSEAVTPGHLFDYFRGDFQADSGPGGTHKAWLETESALAKVLEESTDAQVLKTAFLLGLGLGGERARATRGQLAFAAVGRQRAGETVERSIEELLTRKLLIHREQSDQILVWHGTDVDLRGRLEDERKRVDAAFDLVSFLAKEAPPPVWRPIRHNAETGVPRYLESHFVSGEGLARMLESLVDLNLRNPGSDGHVLYVLPSDARERDDAIQIAEEIEDPRLIVAVAEPTELLRSLALDLAALLRMHHDHELVGQDPMVRTELDHLSDDVRQALRPVVDRVLTPGPKGARWYFRGRLLPVQSAVQLRSELSAIMGDVFSSSPVIMSEMVVRRKPSPVIINARKKVILGILERYSQESVGIEGDFADKAIFRAVFLRTGLYRPEGERWRFADSSELEDPGLAAVWRRVAEFFSEPGSKSLQSLTHELMEPPFGVREGLLPLLVAAGVKAFPTPKAIRSRALFVTDLLPSTIEEMVRSPEDYTVDVVSLTVEQEDYLQDVLARFSAWAPTVAPNDDVIRKAYDAVQGWWEALPASAKATSSISAQARRFRGLIQRPDPVAVLLQEIPDLLGGPKRDLSRAWRGLQACVDELEGMEKRFQAAARAALVSAMEARGLEVGLDIGDAGRTWAGFFPRALPLDSLSPVAKATLGQLRRTHDGERPLIDALALLVAGRALKDWTESTPPEFDRRLRTALEDIEHAALEAGKSAAVGPEVNEGLIDLSRARLRMTLRQLADLAGEEALSEIVAEALSSSLYNKTKVPQ